MSPEVDVFQPDSLDRKVPKQVNEKLRQSLSFDFHLGEEDFSAVPSYYEDETQYGNTLGVVFKIKNQQQQNVGEVVGYLFKNANRKNFVVQYTENAAHFSDKPVPGLVRKFAQEIVRQGVIDTWISSAELNTFSRGMYQKLANEPGIKVAEMPGADFRFPNQNAFLVQRAS